MILFLKERNREERLNKGERKETIATKKDLYEKDKNKNKKILKERKKVKRKKERKKGNNKS